MTDKKLTNSEIINAYKGLTSNQQLNLFKNLYYNDGFSTEKGIVANAINDILTKYYKQQEEIDNLRADLRRVCAERDAHICTNNFIKSEAITEFANEIKIHKQRMFSSDWSGDYQDDAVRVEIIDNLVKEMIGKNNEWVEAMSELSC